MSVIVRLQNLPLSAKSQDIRHFFRGLHIPDGGVHIIGGEKGVAFIAFNSDEDARIGMRKDGGKIRDSKIKLYLSSGMEMQHEIERITKYELMNNSLQRSSNKWRNSARDRSPEHINEKEYERNPECNDWSYRSFSPEKRETSHQFEMNYSSRRSRSPIRRSRSPNSNRPWSPDFRSSHSSHHRSPSVRLVTSHGDNASNYADPFQMSEDKRNIKEGIGERYLENDHFNSSRNVRITSELQNELTTSKEQLQLEERITKALNAEFFKNAFNLSSGLEDTLSLGVNISHRIEEQFPRQDLPFRKEFENPPYFNDPMLGNSAPAPGFLNINVTQGVAPMNLPAPNVMMPPSNLVPPMIPPFTNQTMGALSPVVPEPLTTKPFIPFTGYYVTISGLDAMWTNSDIQAILKGIFAPQENIKWEVDDFGLKTGTAFIKLMSKDDFMQLLTHATYNFENRVITVSECPNIVYEKYFPPPSVPPLPGQNIIQDGDLYYKITGLPFTITYEEIMHFFYGFQIADCYLEDGPGGKTGIGYICFTNIADYERARIMHGKKLGHRLVEIISSSRQEMLDSKRRNGGMFNLATSSDSLYKPLKEKLPFQKRPLCAMLTGLPPFIKITKIAAFFSEYAQKPDAIHLTVNQKRKPTGRAFVEFSNIRDFDAALKCHGNKIGNNMICVKQILYDEMTQILKTQKAKHDYGSRPSNSSNLVHIDLPEKNAPLWEFPSQGNFTEKLNINPWQDGNVMSTHPNNEQYFDNCNQPNIPPVSAIHSGLQAPHGISHFDVQPDPNMNFPPTNIWEDQRHHANKEKYFHPHMGRNLQECQHNEKHRDDVSRAPVKFEVKLKQSITKNTKVDNAFDRNAKAEAHKKLSKLTPEKEVNILKPCNSKALGKMKSNNLESQMQDHNLPVEPPRKDTSSIQTKGSINVRKNNMKKKHKNDSNLKIHERFSPQRGSSERSPQYRSRERFSPRHERISPRRRSRERFIPRKRSRERINPRRQSRERFSPDRHSLDRFSPQHYYREKFSPNQFHEKYSSQYRIHGRSGSDNLSQEELALHHGFHHRSRSPFKNNYIEKTNSRFHSPTMNDSREAIIEMSNVPPVVSTRELQDFFHGFNIIEEKMIRRYSNFGEPLGDVRVSFPNLREANRAIRHLNGQCMNGVPINMEIL